MSKISLQEAIELLMTEKIAAVPTETVYGLAAWIQSEKALLDIFKTKKRPFFDPLIVHVKDEKAALVLSREWTEIHHHLAQTFWPGPLTIITKKSSLIHPLITSGLDSVGLRCPSHSVAQEILAKLPFGFAAPSANIFMQTSPTSADHVEQEFKGAVPVVDGGACEWGIESTIVEPVFENQKMIIHIYRPGSITQKAIELMLAKNHLQAEVRFAQSPVAPGQLKHHYMPRIPLLIQEDEKSIHLHGLQKIASWNVPENPTLSARLLYQKFRDFSNLPLDGMVIKIQSSWRDQDEWQGFMNRLLKAQYSTKI
jgi:L-threonylcarbamoyladenylate synthase